MAKNSDKFIFFRWRRTCNVIYSSCMLHTDDIVQPEIKILANLGSSAAGRMQIYMNQNRPEFGFSEKWDTLYLRLS
jgi:hypothetical protein